MRVLVVKLSSLGDVIQTMPVVADVLALKPDAQIDWVVEEAFAPLVQRLRGVQRVVPIAQRRWRTDRSNTEFRQQRRAFVQNLRAVAYDAVIDFQGLIKSAWVARQARLAPGGFTATYGNASDACSYEWPVRWMLARSYPMPRRIHAVARYRLLAHAALGCAMDGAPRYDLRCEPVAALQDAPSVVFAHGTTRADNEWPQADWLTLGQRCIAQGVSVALPQASAAEAAWAQQLALALHSQASAVHTSARAVVWPRMSLASVLDHMAAAQGVIGVDSGLSHLAVALNLPHVQIFSQPRVWRAGPVGQLHQVAVGGDAAPSVDAVWQAWLDVRAKASGVGAVA